MIPARIDKIYSFENLLCIFGIQGPWIFKSCKIKCILSRQVYYFIAKIGIYSNLWVWLTILIALVFFVSVVTNRQQDFDDHRQIDVHIKYIKVHTATRWTIKHGLMLLWFTDLMNVTEEVTIHRPNVSTLLSSAFIRGDLNAATRGPFIWSLISCLFSDEV